MLKYLKTTVWVMLVEVDALGVVDDALSMPTVRL